MRNDASLSTDSWTTARHLLGSALEMDGSELPKDTAIGQLAEWDSLAHMRLILALEEYLQTQLSPDKLVAIGSLADIATLLEKWHLSSSRG